MDKNVYTVHWKKTNTDGKVIKSAASFETKEERDNFMAELKQQSGIEVYRFTDFEIFNQNDNQ